MEPKDFHLGFDKTVKPSIKDCERDMIARIGDRNVWNEITRLSQKHPNNFTESPRNYVFKDPLMQFLPNSWGDDALIGILMDQNNYGTYGNKSYIFKVVNGQISKKKKP